MNRYILVSRCQHFSCFYLLIVSPMFLGRMRMDHLIHWKWWLLPSIFGGSPADFSLNPGKSEELGLEVILQVEGLVLLNKASGVLTEDLLLGHLSLQESKRNAIKSHFYRTTIMISDSKKCFAVKSGLLVVSIISLDFAKPPVFGWFTGDMWNLHVSYFKSLLLGCFPTLLLCIKSTLTAYNLWRTLFHHIPMRIPMIYGGYPEMDGLQWNFRK